MTDTLSLAKKLIAQQSISPSDAGCQELIIEELKAAGFTITPIHLGDVKNIWATHGETGPIIAFAGHTDVVPPGPIDKWQFDPFTPTEHEGQLHGRGAADMKTSLAAMVIAARDFVQAHPNHPGIVALLITSCEEQTTDNGTKGVIMKLLKEGIKPDYCVIGEAASDKTLGDQIKIGRRGSLLGHITIEGTQGHIAYPHQADNPIPKAMKALAELADTKWDEGTEYFDPTSFQISNIHAGTGADNVIPGELTAQFNFRYSPAVTAEMLVDKVESILTRHPIRYQLEWRFSGEPFFSEPGPLTMAASKAINDVLKKQPKFSTSGGTSDGRFIAPCDVSTIELGFINATIHQINERVPLADIGPLTKIYFHLLQNILL